MNGRQRIEAAFSEGGTTETPAVICYEGIYVRDHWGQITAEPWWDWTIPDVERQMAWRRQAIEKTGQDWFALPSIAPRAERDNTRVEARPDGVYRIDRRTGRVEALAQPTVGGWTVGEGTQSIRPESLATTRAQIDLLIPVAPHHDPADVRRDGRADLADRMLAEFGGSLFPICHVGSPLWLCYHVWGFEGLMTMVGERPDLVRYACDRYLINSVRAVREAAALGAAGIWIEECLTDMVSPAAFADLNVPYVRLLVEVIRAAGMKSIYYYCGDPSSRWDQLFAVGADALSLEESKKGFRINVDEVVERARGRCAVLGNLDAIDLLTNGSEAQLRAEVARQVAAGRRNGGRFIMSLGSPVTPATPVQRVRQYCDVVHELGGS
jgi:hypothetical protein